MRRVLQTMLLLMCIALPAWAQEATPAERQYQLARRLIAENSPAAAEALDRVIELDPKGALADDAMIERMLLQRPARWPQELGRLGPAEHADLLRRTAALLEAHPNGDRARETRLLRALLFLEPIAGFDRESARAELFTLTTDPKDDRWSVAARYILGWIAVGQAQEAVAEAAWSRLWVDQIDDPAVCWAARGLAELQLHNGNAVGALESLQRAQAACSTEADDGMLALALAVWRGRVASELEITASLAFKPSNLAAGAQGSLIVDRRGDRVVELDASGAERRSWPLADAVDVAVDARGIRYGFNFDTVVRFEEDGGVLPLLALDAFGPISAGTVDAHGTIWVLDRRGSRIGRAAPGSPTIETHWNGDRVRLNGLTWDGRRLLGADTRNGAIVAVYPDRSSQTVIPSGLDRPLDVCADAAGRIAVLEARGASVQLFDAAGASLGHLGSKDQPLGRLSRVDFAPDGSLRAISETESNWRSAIGSGASR